MKRKIRYIVEYFDAKSKKWKIDIVASTFKRMSEKLAIKWIAGYYKDKNGKMLRLRVRCVEMEGRKVVRVWENYKITKSGKIYGYFTNWERMKCGKNEKET